jgi:protein-tyrosine phosphatase
MAEGVFTQLVKDAGLAGHFTIDSCGTGGHHAGEAPDSRMVRTAARRGINLAHLRARKFSAKDFESFDLILAMDRSNLRNIEEQRRGREVRARIQLMREYDNAPDSMDVPDPWYGGQEGFEEVSDLLERCCVNLLQSLRKENGI